MTNEEQIWLSAVRYGLGRRTYITGVISEFMIEQVWKMSQHCREVMMRDIRSAKGNYGDPVDQAEWMKLLNKLELKDENKKYV